MLLKHHTDGHLRISMMLGNISKALSNKTRDITAIGGKEFKPLDNLTMKWIKTSKLGQLLWVICIDNDGERKFPIKAHKI